MIRAFLLCLAFVGFVLPAQAQFLPSSSEGRPAVSTENLTPELIDGMLARLTDAEIREVLRAELVRQSEERMAAEAGPGVVALIEARLTEMSDRIQTRVTRWARALANIDNRFPEVEKRMMEGEFGVAGMILAALAVVGAGFGAAFGVARITRSWRDWLKTPTRTGYWDKVVRTVALGLVEALVVVAFMLATEIAVPLLSGPLGRFEQLHWIYETGVSRGWLAIIIARRAFAPDAPQIRIAPLNDVSAISLFRLLRRAALIMMGGWVIAGSVLLAGFGFPPAMVINALAGTIVAALMLRAIVVSVPSIRTATAAIVGEGDHVGAFSRIAIAASPAILALYILGAWAYWLALWLENGRHFLAGPLGTLLVYLLMPIVDQMGAELVRSAIRSDTETAERFRRVFHGFWRLFIGLVAIIFVLWLWGFDLIGVVARAEAPMWFGAVLNVIATLLVGYVLWRLVRAALHTERRTSDASEDVDPSEIPAATRLDTLTPLFRNVILFFLAAVIFMIALSAIGVDIGPLIASAGIIGIAVGFGAQALVRDVLSGVFFLIDDAFRVGEYIELENDMRGEVENISVRSLQLRHHRGPVITIPFGELRNITNHNRDWVIYKMMFRMEPDTDPQRLKKVVKKVGAEFMEHPVHGPKFIEPLKSQGVYYIDDDSALVIRLKFKCKPRAQFVLRRDIYHRMRVVFEEHGFKLARRKVEVVSSDGRPLTEQEKAAVPEEVLTNPPPAPTV